MPIEQEDAVFNCQHCSNNILYLNWKVNGQIQSNVHTSDVNGGGRKSTLRLLIQNSLDMNGTNISCIAGFSNQNPPFEETDSVMLLIQGLLLVK